MMRTSMNRLGRFSSPDPLAGSVADPQTLNRYAYTLNDPVNFADPLGLNPWFLPAIEGGTDAFIGLLLGGGEIQRWGIYLGLFCSPVYTGDPAPEGFAPAGPVAWDCGPTQGRGGGRRWDSGHPRVVRPFNKELRKASELAAKKKCADFLNQVFQNAFLAARGSDSPLAPGELPFFYQSEAGGVPGTLFSASLQNRKNENPVGNGYRTNAQAFFETQTVALYQGFFEQGTTGKAQILLHEGLHLLMGFTDEQLAAAAGRHGRTREEASANFQQELETNCK